MAAADALPEYHHRERHSLAVDAVPERALTAARTTTIEEVPLVRVLLRLRGMRRVRRGPVWEVMAAEGFATFDDETLVAVGRPWRLREGLRPVADFAAFDEPGWAKMAVDLRFEDRRLVTETRVLLTSPDARRAFRRYWVVVRPLSGLVRRRWLAAARRRAEG